MKTDTQIAERLAASSRNRNGDAWLSQAYERAVRDGDVEEIERLTQMPAEGGARTN